MAVMLVFKFMNSLWHKCGKQLTYYGKRVKILTYNIVPVNDELGFIELINGCISLRDIKNILQYHDIKSDKNQKIIHNLLVSSVASFIGCFIMGIRDRHNEKYVNYY